MMEFRIADTFTESLARLTDQEQKAAKTAAFDLQMDPERPGLKPHKLAKSKDPGFLSFRVNRDIRLIAHQSEASLLLCYVDHHDKAYQWAERRKLETHPKTGAAQLVEIRETVREYTIPKYAEETPPATRRKPLFSHISEDDLLNYGVPAEWIGDVRQADEDSLLELAEHLPGEAAEALLELATGGKPQISRPAPEVADPFSHPDAQRRFRIVKNVEELRRALDYPWEKWTIFLHPDQRQLVEKNYNGPARVSGSAGTGKTIVALHRAVFLARENPDARVLLCTFSETLANALKIKLRRLIEGEPLLAERLEVYAMDAIGKRLYELNFGPAEIASAELIKSSIEKASAKAEAHRFSMNFLLTEWDQVVDSWGLRTWEDYRDVKRLGRKTRLPEKQRAVLWSIFAQVRSDLEKQALSTGPDLFGRLAEMFSENKQKPFDHIVVDESQDIGIAQLRFLASLGGQAPDGLFFAGDLGQRIFQQPFSWKSLGVDIRGRSRTLKVNYRTSHQIRTQADLLLGPSISDVDGNQEERKGTISVFNGPEPAVKAFDSPEEEAEAVGKWISERFQEGIKPHEIGVFVRSEAQLDRAAEAVKKAGASYLFIDETLTTTAGKVVVGTMHLAKGLEFRAVAVMACDDEIVPLSERIETVSDESDLEEVYNTERHLLYVACTRARDRLLATGAEPASEFLDDLGL